MKLQEKKKLERHSSPLTKSLVDGLNLVLRGEREEDESRQETTRKLHFRGGLLWIDNREGSGG